MKIGSDAIGGREKIRKSNLSNLKIPKQIELKFSADELNEVKQTGMELAFSSYEHRLLSEPMGSRAMYVHSPVYGHPAGEFQEYYKYEAVKEKLFKELGIR